MSSERPEDFPPYTTRTSDDDPLFDELKQRVQDDKEREFNLKARSIAWELRSQFRAFREQGFTEPQAMLLTQQMWWMANQKSNS